MQLVRHHPRYVRHANRMERIYRTNNIPLEFFHRPDFRAAYPDVEVELPVILSEDNGEIKTILSASEMKAAADVPGLIRALSSKLEASNS